MPDLFLKSISIGNRRNTRQYCYFLDDSLSFLLPGISMINTFVEIIVVYVVSIFVFAVNDVRIHGIVCIVDTDIPGAYAMFGFLLKLTPRFKRWLAGRR